MNEITKIHLGRQAFTISVGAYKALQTYLHEIKRQAGENGKDVAEEVELRMAELLNERGITAEKVVLLKDVEYLKEQLGSPSDFKDEDDEHSQAEAGKEKDQASDNTAVKRLFRDTEHGMLAGVSAGLAAYFHIDAVIVRLMFILATITGGWGIPLYIILWLIVPEVKTSSDRLQMQGKPVTVDSLKEIVDRADIPGAAARSSAVVGKVLKVMARVLLGVVGVAFAFAGAVALCALLVAVVYAMIHGGQVSGQTVFPIGTAETAALLLGGVSAAIISVFVLLAGVALLTMKWRLPAWATIGLIVVAMVTGGVGAALSADAVPRVRDRFEALHRTQTLSVAQFDKVELNGRDSRYYFQPDSDYYIEVRAIGDPKNDALQPSVKDRTLSLDTSKIADQELCNFMCFYNSHDIEVTIHAPSLSSITLHGENSMFVIDRQPKQVDMSLTADDNTAFNLHFMRPQTVHYTSNPDQNHVSLQLNGLRPDAFESDDINWYGYGDALRVSRATHVELETNGHCEMGETLLDVFNDPESVTVNGRLFPTKGDLRALQQNDQPFVFNCVDIH